ncbi:MAG TPA: lipid-binding SYLF domain-containing protein [Bryobacteraceae bacterium]|nr:lipid-binding SYLF domain-containing protein [Bryobacteraceae bacterium]HPT25653.1 lipid-binding SYLF domain-containing protein [Bryobacteraceae bacterium]
MRTLIGLFVLAAVASAGEAEDKRLNEAATVLTEIMGTGDNAIPQNLIEKAACAVIVPGMKKGGFIVGAKYGRGFATCRKATGVGWSAPSGVRIEGGSVGFQIGGAEVDIILLVMNKKGMDRLTSSKFTLGGEASVAAGPVGRDTQAQTDASMRAEILSWSRSRGVFGGIALQGATLRRDTEVDTALYGANKPVLEILDGHIAPPAAAKSLLATLNKYSSRPNK